MVTITAKPNQHPRDWSVTLSPLWAEQQCPLSWNNVPLPGRWTPVTTPVLEPKSKQLVVIVFGI